MEKLISERLSASVHEWFHFPHRVNGCCFFRKILIQEKESKLSDQMAGSEIMYGNGYNKKSWNTCFPVFTTDHEVAKRIPSKEAINFAFLVQLLKKKKNLDKAN